MAENTENDEVTGTISTQRHQRVRFRIGHDCGDVFGLDSNFDGISLTLEVADHADAQAMLEAIAAPTTTAIEVTPEPFCSFCAEPLSAPQNQATTPDECLVVNVDGAAVTETAPFGLASPTIMPDRCEISTITDIIAKHPRGNDDGAEPNNKYGDERFHNCTLAHETGHATRSQVLWSDDQPRYTTARLQLEIRKARNAGLEEAAASHIIAAYKIRDNPKNYLDGELRKHAKRSIGYHERAALAIRAMKEAER